MWCIEKISDEKGYGLLATEEIQVGCHILEENPIVSCQFSWNKFYKYRACNYCMKSLETAENMCKRLLQNEVVTLPHPECCLSTSIDLVHCSNCEAEYCCSQCLESAFKEYHQVLCPKSGYFNHDALNQLDETWRSFHYPPETSTIMLIIRIIARIKQEGNSEEFKEIIEQFCHRCKSESGELVHKLLGDKFKEQLNILREQLKSFFYEESVSHWFTEDGFQTLFALLGANQQGIGTSAFSVWVKNCDNLKLCESEEESLDAFIDNLYEELDKVAGIFLNCEGSGLYVTQSKCNHSCSPNAEVCFLHNDNRLTLKSLRNISQGEEITISYLSECELSRSRHSRQKHLKENYLFICVCEKCQSQCGDPDESSSEEEDDDMSVN